MNPAPPDSDVGGVVTKPAAIGGAIAFVLLPIAALVVTVVVWLSR